MKHKLEKAAESEDDLGTLSLRQRVFGVNLKEAIGNGLLDPKGALGQAFSRALVASGEAGATTLSNMCCFGEQHKQFQI